MDRLRPGVDLDVLLAATPDAMLVVDRQGLIVQANSLCDRMFGYEPGELAGKPVDAFVPTERHELQRLYDETYAAAGDPSDRHVSIEVATWRKDGSTMRIEISLGPLETDDGALVLAALREVSRSRHDEGLFRRFLEAAPDAVVVVDASGQMILVNARAEEIFGYQRAELLGRPVELLVPGRFAEMHGAFRSAYVEEPRPRPIGVAGGLYGLHKDGTEFPVEIALAPLKTDEGVLVLADVRDVTERLAVTAAMLAAEERHRVQEETNRAKDEFFATLSHELRTPLASIVGFTELLCDDEDLSPQCRHFVEIIMRNGRREMRLVDDLLTVATINERGLTMHADDVDLAALVREAVDSAGPQATERELSLHLQVQEAPVVARCDGERIGQAIDNLLSNALKFTPPGGVVELRVSSTATTARVEVTDSGIGIDGGEPHRVFERLYRAPRAVQHEIPGAGLGLSIASAIVAAHHGTLRVLSTGETGSTFELEIPLDG